MKKTLVMGAWCAAVMLGSGMAGQLWAQDLTRARNLASACFTCHGTDGRSVEGVPASLAGQNKDHLLQQLKDFKSGKRPATIMHQQAKGYTDQQLEIIAGYFASMKAGAAAPAPAARSGN
jgi:cytochrome subunit of sulfide dehydrogenase